MSWRYVVECTSLRRGRAMTTAHIVQEQNRQYALLIENQKQQRARLEDQRQYGASSSMVIIARHERVIRVNVHCVILLVWPIESSAVRRGFCAANGAEASS